MTRPPALLALAVGWAASRALMLWLLIHDDLPLLGGGRWPVRCSGCISAGTASSRRARSPRTTRCGSTRRVPVRSLPSPALLLTLTYSRRSWRTTLAADLLILLALTRAEASGPLSARRRVLDGESAPLLPVPLARYDVQVTAFAVISLLTSSRSPRARAFAALGAPVKVWPALVLLVRRRAPRPGRRGRPRRSRRRPRWPSWRRFSATLSPSCASRARRRACRSSRLAAPRSPSPCVPMEARALPVRRDGVRGPVRHLCGGAVPRADGRRVRAPGAVAGAGPVLDPGDTVRRAAALDGRTPVHGHQQGDQPAVPGLAARTGRRVPDLTAHQSAPGGMVAPRPRPSAASYYPVLYSEVVHCTWTGVTVMLVRNGLLAAAAVLSFVWLWRSARPARPRRRFLFRVFTPRTGT